jgi:transglutaminase superfamily protein
MRAAPPRMPAAAKAFLILRIWRTFFVVFFETKTHPLPEVVRRLNAAHGRSRYRIDPRRQGRIVGRVLRAGPWRARCVWTALVLYALLRRQGDEPDLVIGLPLEPRDRDAHAWIELDGIDVGPPPGRGRHTQLARYN